MTSTRACRDLTFVPYAPIGPGAFVQSSHCLRRLSRLSTMIATAGSASPPASSLPVLVTGATGFLGTHLCTALRKQGYSVHTLSRRALPQNDTNHHVCDLAAADTGLDALLHSQQWHAVIHLAGLISYTRSDSAAMEEINVKATTALVETLTRDCPDTKLLFCSSVAAVGSNAMADDAPLNESAVWDKTMDALAYPRTKHAAEDVVLHAGRAGWLKAAAICPSNIYGAGDGAKASRRTQVRAANGRARIYTLGGVSIVHVSVVVQAFLALLKAPSDDAIWRGTRWLLSGDNVTIRDMLTLCAVAGGNGQHAAWLRLPNWLLAVVCVVGETFGSRSLTWARFRLATRFHWFDGSKAQKRFDLRHIPACDAIADSVQWMREQGMVRPR